MSDIFGDPFHPSWDEGQRAGVRAQIDRQAMLTKFVVTGDEVTLGHDDEVYATFRKGPAYHVLVAMGCNDTFYGLYPFPFHLGRFLFSLGVTAEDCRAAIEDDLKAREAMGTARVSLPPEPRP